MSVNANLGYFLFPFPLSFGGSIVSLACFLVFLVLGLLGGS